MLDGTKRSTTTTRVRTGLLAGPLVTMLCVPALAGPQGEDVVAGSAKFKRQGDRTVIRVSDRAIINYDSFNIAGHETVRFIQPGSDSRVLNRITGPDPSRIDGTLRANGQVFIVNPAGVYFGQGALVDVGQLYAAAGNISNRDFMAGNLRFGLQGEVVNEGTLRGEGITLLGTRVANFGRIVAPQGMVTMVAGDEVWIGQRGSHVFAKIDSSRLTPGIGVENAGTIMARDGRVILGAGDLYALVLHDTSKIVASRIELDAGAGTIASVSGVLDASDLRDGGVGGTIDILGDKVALYGARVDARGDAGGGTVHIGGDYQGKGERRSSQRTFVDADSVIDASAMTSGDGGTVIVWADEATGFGGTVRARGGSTGGDGGFAEVSGKGALVFSGTAEMGANKGTTGTLLLDPLNITIVDDTTGADDTEIADGSILSTDRVGDSLTISETALEGLGDVSILLQADNNITVNSLTTDGVLNLGATSGNTVVFTADADGDGAGAFTMLGTTDTIRTQGGSLTINADSIALGTNTLDTSGGGGSGAITLLAADGAGIGSITTGGGAFTVDANTDAPDVSGDFTLNAGASVATSGGAVSITGTDWILGAGSSINAGAGDVTFNLNTGIVADVGLGVASTVDLDATELGQITTSGTFAIGTAGTAPRDVTIEDFDLGGTSTITGAVDINATRDVTFSTSASTFSDGLTVVADGGVTIGTGVTIGGDASFTADADGDNNDGGDADIFTLGAGTALDAGTNTLAIDASDVELGIASSVTATDITIDRGAGGTVGLGADNGEDLVLESTELSALNATTLTIGSSSISLIRGDGIALPNVTGLVTLDATLGTGTIEFVNTDSVFPAGLDLIAANGVSLTSASVTVAGNSTIDANDDDLADAGSLTIADDQTFATGGSDLQIIASNLVLGTGGAAQRIDAGAGTLLITHWNTTATIHLGVDAGASMSITAAELAKITAGDFIVGADSSTTGRAAGETVRVVRVDGASMPNISGTVTLNALSGTGLVNFTGAASSVPAGLAVFAEGGIAMDASLTTGGATTFDSGVFDTLLGDGTSINTAGGSLEFFNNVRLLNDADVSLTTAGGTVDFDGNLFGAAGGAVETITIDAGAGDLTFVGSITGDGTSTSGTGLTDVTITNAGATSLQSVLISGALTSTNALTGALTTNGNDITVGSMDLTGTVLTFAGVTATAGGMTIDNSGLLDLNGDINLQGGFDQNSTAATGTVDLAGDIFVNDLGSITFESGLTLSAGFNGTFDAGPNSIVLGGGADTNGMDLTLIANAIDFGAAVNDGTGGGASTLRLLPDDVTTAIDVGTVGVGQGGLTLDATDIGNISNGYALIQIGYETTGAHNIQIGTATFLDPVEFQAPLGGLSVVNTLTGNDNASILLQGPGTTTLLGADITTAGNSVTINDAVVIAEGTSPTISTSGGNLTITGAIRGLTGGIAEALSIALGTGTLDIQGAITGDGTTADATGLASVSVTSVGAADLAGVDIASAFSIDNSGLFTIDSDITAGSFTQASTATTGTVDLGADISTRAAGGDQSFASAVTVSGGNRSLDAGTGGFTVANTFGAGGFDVTFTGNRLDLTGGADSVTGTGVLTIRPDSAATDLDVGNITGAGGTAGSGLRFGLGDYAAIGGGFSSVEFGFAGTGTHAIQVAGLQGGFASDNPLVFHASAGGQVTLLNTLQLTNQDLTVNGNSVFGASLEVTTGTAGQSWNGSIAAGAFNATLTGNRLDLTGGADSVTGSGVLTIRPADATTDLDVGNITGAGGTAGSGLRFGLGDYNAIAGGFSSVEFGFAGTGTHTIQVAGLDGGFASDNALVFHAPTGVGVVSILNNLTLSDQNLTVNGDALTGSSLIISTGTGGQSYNGAIALGGFDTIFEANRLDLNGGADTVLGTGQLTIRPADVTTDFDIGDVTGAGGTAGTGLRWGLGDMAALADGFGAIHLGFAGTGQNQIQIGNVTGASAFNDPTTFFAPAGAGRIIQFGSLNGAGNGSFTFDGPFRVGAGAAASITTANGSVTFNDVVDGTTGGGAESLTLTLGTGDLDFLANIFGDAGASAADATGLTDLTVSSVGDANFEMIALTGPLFVDNSGTVCFNGDIEAGSVSQVSTAGTGDVLVGGNIDTSAADGTISFASMVALKAGPLTFDAGNGLISFGDMLDLAGFDLTLTSGDLDFGGGPGSVKDTVGGSGLTFAPNDDSDAIDVGNVAAPQAGAFTIDNTDLAALDVSLGPVTIGRPTGTHTNFQVQDATFAVDLTLQSPNGGQFILLDGITGTGAGNGLTILGAGAPGTIQLGGDIATNGGAVDITGPIVLTGDSTISSGGGADVIINNTIDGAFGLTLTGSTGGAGKVSVRDVVGGTTALTSLTATGFDVLFSGLGTAGSQGVTGATLLTSIDSLILNGGTYNAGAMTFDGGTESRINIATTIDSNNNPVEFRTSVVRLRNGAPLSIDAGTSSIRITNGIENDSSTVGTGDVVLMGDTIDVLGAIGATNAVGSLNATATTSNRFVGTRTVREQVYTGPTTFLRGVYDTLTAGMGAFTVTGALNLEGDTTITTAGAGGDDARFDSTIDGGFALTVDAGSGLGRFLGLIGGTTPLASADLSGFDVRLTGIGTALAEGVTGATTVTALDDILFTGGLYNANAQTYTAADENRITQTTQFISSGDDISFMGAGFVRLQTNTAMSVMTNGGDATFATPVAGDSGVEDLAVDAGTGTASFQQVGSNPDGTTPGAPTLDQLAFTGDEIELNELVFGNDILLQSSTPTLAIELGGTAAAGRLDLSASEIANLADGFATITIGRADGMHAMRINAVAFTDPTTFQNPMGTTSVVGGLAGIDDATLTFLGGTTELGADVTTTGNNVTFDSTIAMIGDSTVDTDGGDIDVTGTVDGAGSLSLLALMGNTGKVRLEQAVGTTTALTNLTIDAFDVGLNGVGTQTALGVTGAMSVSSLDDIIFRSMFYNANNQTYDAGAQNRIVTNPMSFLSSGTAINFNTGVVTLFDGSALTVRSSGGDVTIGVDGLESVAAPAGPATVLIDAGAGMVDVMGTIGAAFAPAGVDITGSTIALQAVNTGGNQTYTGDTTLNGDLTSTGPGAITLTGAHTLGADVSITTGGAAGDDVVLTGTLDGGFDVLFNLGDDGDLTITGNTGDTTRVGHFQISNARDITLGGVRATRVTQTAGRGTTTVNGAIDTTATEGIVMGDGVSDFNFFGMLNATGGAVTINGDDSLFDAGIAAGSGGIDVMGNVITVGGPVSTTDNGNTSFDNSGLLTVRNDTTFALTGDFSQLGAAPVSFGAPEIRTNGNEILFTGPMTLTTDEVLLRADRIELMSTVDSDATARTLRLTARNEAITGGAIGGTAALDEFRFAGTVDASTLRVGDDITTTGRQRFNGRTEINGPATLTAGDRVDFESSLTTNAATSVIAGDTLTVNGAATIGGDTMMMSKGTMTFADTIDGASGTPGALTLVLDAMIPRSEALSDSEAADLAKATPIIRLSGSGIGTTNPLGDLSLNMVAGSRLTPNGNGDFDAFSFPTTATIVLGTPGAVGDAVPDFVVNASAFETGFFEKITAHANLDITADRVRFGDANVLGTLRVTSPDITLLTRPRGTLLEQDAGILVRSAGAGADIVVAGIEASATPGQDSRVDEVIFFSSDPTADSFAGAEGGIFISAPRGRDSVGTQGTLSDVTVVKPNTQFERDDFFADTLDLDLNGQGVGGNPATARALAVAAAAELGELPEDTTVSTRAAEKLNEIGINIRAATQDTLIDALIGSALYNDIPPAQGGKLQTTTNRLDFDLVDRVLADYLALFYEIEYDDSGVPMVDETGQIVRVNRSGEIKEALEIAVDAYYDALDPAEFDAGEFLRFLREQGGHELALDSIESLRHLLDQLQLLGLSPAEMANAENKLLSYIAPENMDFTDFESTVHWIDLDTTGE